MRMRSVKNLFVMILLCVSCVTAHAGDGDRREQGGRPTSGSGGDGNAGGRDEQREPRQAAQPERQRDAGPVLQTPSPEQRAEPPQDRRGNRMSPEDRRALRKQIDQASHDIYAPNR